MADYYDALAADYDWLFDDDTLAHGAAINHPATARLLERTPRASLVLDAACGTGVNAAALARRGYRVWAADGSGAMAAVAAARFRSEHLDIPVVRSLWRTFRRSSPNGSTSCSASGTRSCTRPGGTP
jgi:SAM-dependent methyltransferase